MAKRIKNTTPKQDGFRMPVNLKNKNKFGCFGLGAMIIGGWELNLLKRLF